MKSKIRAVSPDQVEFSPAPIPAEWIISGSPTAQNYRLFDSIDKVQWSLIWRCTAGIFRWIYHEDETIHMLEGEMTLCFDDGSRRHCSAGDVVFFPAGTSCVWVIEKEVKKLAFFHPPVPRPFAFAMRLMRRFINRSMNWQANPPVLPEISAEPIMEAE